ncbi:MAG: hypothetical protein U1F47_02395 [Hyphomicrobiales bacterium]
MAEFLNSGRLADVILVLLAGECIVVSIYLSGTGRRSQLGGFLAMMASGAALVVALRTALTGGSWAVIIVALLISLVAHLADLVIRLRGRSMGENGSGTSSPLRNSNRET